MPHEHLFARQPCQFRFTAGLCCYRLIDERLPKKDSVFLFAAGRFRVFIRRASAQGRGPLGTAPFPSTNDGGI